MKVVFSFVVIFLFCFPSWGQNNLEFSRVVDTILTVSLDGEIDQYNGMAGDFLSPEDGKVYKINNILVEKQKLFSGSCPLCDLPPYSMTINDLSTAIVLGQENESIVLCKHFPVSGSTGNQQPTYAYYDDAVDCISGESPLWLSEESTLTIYAFIPIQNNSVCCYDITLRAFVSLVEFNVSE